MERNDLLFDLESIPPNFFLPLSDKFSGFFAIKLGCFTVYPLFCYVANTQADCNIVEAA
jgi:hypothetical protein